MRAEDQAAISIVLGGEPLLELARALRRQLNALAKPLCSAR
jgi:hypothetical protein